MTQSSNGHHELIDATLRNTRLHLTGCLVSNKAAEELERLGAGVLPDIEAVLHDQIFPASEGSKDHNELLQMYPGLLDLWSAYFRIEQDGTRIVKFLGSLRGPVLAAGVLALRSMRRGDDNFPEPIVQFVVDVSRSANANEALAARLFLKDVTPSAPSKGSP